MTERLYTHYRQEKHVAYMGISNPTRRNALNLKGVQELLHVLRQAITDPEVQVIVMAGADGQTFCAGADLQELVATKSLALRNRFFLALAALLTEIQYCPKPTVAKVQGYALAGGLGIVAACDYVWASVDAQFGLPEALVGLAPLVVLAPIARVIGSSRSTQLALSGQRISAEEASRYGLVTKLCPSAELDAAVDTFAQSLVHCSAQALALSKRYCQATTKAAWAKELKRRALESAKFSLSASATEGVNAFLEKRKPAWSTARTRVRAKGKDA